MILIAKTRLQPKSQFRDLLFQTLERANESCNYITLAALRLDRATQDNLYRTVYHEVKEKFDLTSQMVIRLILRVADLQKQGNLSEGQFQPLDPISYDSKILTWNLDKKTVSLWTVAGRKTIPFDCGSHQVNLLKNQRGE